MLILFINLIEWVLPKKCHLAFRYSLAKIRGEHDLEMEFIDALLKDRRCFLDVGANMGIYTYKFSKTFASIVSFEPIIEVSRRISNLSVDNVRVRNDAVSNEMGNLLLHIPIERGVLLHGLASLESRDTECEKRKVPVTTIDHCEFTDVDFLKIDVEGHELNVVQGALKTIRQCLPVVLIEIEQRHIEFPVQKVFDLLISQGFEGYFLSEMGVRSICDFNYDCNQKPYLGCLHDVRYINNFIFTHPSRFSADEVRSITIS